MKLEMPDELYFELAQTANSIGITPVEHISKMQQFYSNTVRTYEMVTQEELDYFKNVLHMTIAETLVAQEDLANSDEGTEADRKMVDVLNILFARATRDYALVCELLKEFYGR